VNLCDLTQFYSPVSGGVKRYIHEKRRYITRMGGHRHLLIVPGETDSRTVEGPCVTYTIRSPRVDTTSRYRALLRLGRVREILRAEHPDLVECGDPYHVAWSALDECDSLGIATTGFYHSHFPDAYLRTAGKYLGRLGADWLQDVAENYIARLYTRFGATLVPSPHLRDLLYSWGVRNAHEVTLGVDTETFYPEPREPALRAELGAPEGSGRTLLLSVGRLAPEKNVLTLLKAFELLHRHNPDRWALVCLGDGPLRRHVEACRHATGAVTWHSYIESSAELARYYRACDMLVHPGVLETFGLVTVEAQACGIPVVGIRGTFMDRLVFAGLDCWAAENHPASLAQAIEKMASQPLASLGTAAARAAHAQYGWDTVFARLFSLYEQTIYARIARR
jgi:alpha-1,6-mannosyltransferase